MTDADAEVPSLGKLVLGIGLLCLGMGLIAVGAVALWGWSGATLCVGAYLIWVAKNLKFGEKS